MSQTPSFHPAVLAAREKLASGHQRMQAQHERGSPGIQVCAGLTALVDEVLLDLYWAALDELPTGSQLASQVVLVAHGGYGRRRMAPFSDVDLIIGGVATDSLTGLNQTTNWGVDVGSHHYTDVGTGTSLVITSIESLIGGSGVDTFTVQGSQVANLSGGSGDDTFAFLNQAVLDGNIDGGDGNDTLDLGSYTSDLSVTLSGIGTADGLAGETSGPTDPITGTFDNIDVLATGGVTTDDTLYGPDDQATWSIASTDIYADLATGQDLDFSGIENLSGGSDIDEFVFTADDLAEILPHVIYHLESADGHVERQCVEFVGLVQDEPTNTVPGAGEYFVGRGHIELR